MTELSLAPKEVEQTKEVLTELQLLTDTLTVTSPDDVKVAATILEQIKGQASSLTKRKEEITRPLMNSLASVRDLFRPFEQSLDQAKAVVKRKVLDYQNEEAAKVALERERIQARLEKGTMRPDTALEKLGAIEEPAAKVGKMQTRSITKVRVADIDKVPREWLLPDMPRITEAVLRNGIEIPGVETYKEKIIAV